MVEKMLVLWVVMLFVGGCATLPPPLVGLPSTATPGSTGALTALGTEPPAVALPHLVLLERQASIDKNLAPVISICYGACEALNGPTFITSLQSLMQQAKHTPVLYLTEYLNRGLQSKP